jgi:hypothetical protein
MDDCLFSSALKTAQIDYHTCRFSIYIHFANGFQPLIAAGPQMLAMQAPGSGKRLRITAFERSAGAAAYCLR